MAGSTTEGRVGDVELALAELAKAVAAEVVGSAKGPGVNAWLGCGSGPCVVLAVLGDGRMWAR